MRFLGGMASSTTCSIKLLRWLTVLKAFQRDLYTAVHPEMIRPVRLSGKVIEEGTIRNVYSFKLVFLLIFFLGTTFVAVDAARAGLALPEFEALSASAATFFNIGPAFGIAGPMDNYGPFSDATKLVMALLMWVGRYRDRPGAGAVHAGLVDIVRTRGFERRDGGRSVARSSVTARPRAPPGPIDWPR